MLIHFCIPDLSTTNSTLKSQIISTANARNSSMVVLLDLVAFDTVCHSVLLLCLHDRVDVTLSALVLLCQHRNSDLHPQSAIKCRMV